MNKSDYLQKFYTFRPAKVLRNIQFDHFDKKRRENGASTNYTGNNETGIHKSLQQESTESVEPINELLVERQEHICVLKKSREQAEEDLMDQRCGFHLLFQQWQNQQKANGGTTQKEQVTTYGAEARPEWFNPGEGPLLPGIKLKGKKGSELAKSFHARLMVDEEEGEHRQRFSIVETGIDKHNILEYINNKSNT